MEEKVKREINALKRLQHPHIICLYQVINWKTDYFLVLELAQGGDMYDRILEQGKVRSKISTQFSVNLLCVIFVFPAQFSESESRRLFSQLTAALVFSHAHGVAHRDLKLENLLFDAKNDLKIADFGLCNRMHDGLSLKTSCGSPDYCAPEIIEHVSYDGTKVDAWSCGVILYTMLYG